MEIYLQFLKPVGYVFTEVISDIITKIILSLRNMKNKLTKTEHEKINQTLKKRISSLLIGFFTYVVLAVIWIMRKHG